MFDSDWIIVIALKLIAIVFALAISTNLLPDVYAFHYTGLGFLAGLFIRCDKTDQESNMNRVIIKYTSHGYVLFSVSNIILVEYIL